MIGLISVAAAALALSAPQDAPPQTTLPDVVVEGRNLEELVRGFVEEVGAPVGDYGPARWDRSVCIGVVNLRRELAQQMIDRMSAVALEVGLEPGQPGCRPNVLVIAAADGGEMARALVEARPGLFLTHVSGANQSRSELADFQATDRPVRWWHISLPVDSDTGQAAVRMPGYGPAATGNTFASRLRTGIQSDLQRVFIIVDFNRAGGANLIQISDYVAMVALAQIDPDAQTAGYDTVLNLFGSPETLPRITDWDLSYLRALYSAELDQARANAQSNEVARGMARDQRRDGDE
ncbi:hypothetical protein [Brevundimonas lenta]|uniref:DUF2927 domain-containing protein n=1 Tax=Brevundimonas lenta TaxID=424796 RepID=A0A7W6JEJ3_9CAUL|nr:hypothetical protein [Brevundimonas lenta]MBB4082677.1 hypothetical protein [Brevundimonas lenta]